jgi:hypothetical protein
MSVHYDFMTVRWTVFCLLAAMFASMVSELSGIRRPTKMAFSQSIYQLDGLFFVSECIYHSFMCL